MRMVGWAVVAAGGYIALAAPLLGKHVGSKLLLGKRVGSKLLLGKRAGLVMALLLPGCVDLMALLLPGCVDVMALLLPGCVDLMALLLPGCVDLMALLLPGCVDLVALPLPCLDLHHRRCLNFEFGHLGWVAEWTSWWWLMVAG